MSSPDPDQPRYTIVLVPAAGRGAVRQVDLTTRHLRRIAAASSLATVLSLLGLAVLLGIGGGAVPMGPGSQRLELLEQTVLDVEAELEQLQLQHARLQAISAGYGPMDEDERAELSRVVEAARSGQLDAVETQGRASALLDRLRQLQRETERLIGAELARRDTTPDIWPTQGYLTSGFGMRRSPIDRQWKFHKGIDIGAPRGTPVIAPAAGTIVRANYSPSYGNVVEIRHRDGLMTRYGHNSQIMVAEGQSVFRGDVIALIGSTGRSTGPHLHYEVHIDGEAVDPLEYIRD
jgi:murein DD-endopeptidase MepM/ murein hydrolase activator NlpD